MRIGNWRRSQRSSGYYVKINGRLPQFLTIESAELTGDHSKYRYITFIKRGICGEKSIIGYHKTLKDAKDRLNMTMRKHPRGIGD